MDANRSAQPNVPLAFRVGRMMWSLPLRFGAVKLLGARYSLRCVLFHEIADEPSPFTNGLRLTVSRRVFENAIEFVAKYYTPIGISDVVAGLEGREMARPPVLVTFDDAYSSVALEAAPLLRAKGIPAAVFVNASTIDNEDLLLDNFICYVANTSGLEALNAAARHVTGQKGLVFESLTQLFEEFLPSLAQAKVRDFRSKLAADSGLDTRRLARQARINVTSEQLRALVASGFEIGNHTYTHVRCRSLRGDDFDREILENKAKLESLTGTRVRAFSVPYGSAADLTGEVLNCLRRSGHQATFLVDSCSNTPATDVQRINRVSIHARTDADLFSEVEVLPRLRSIRNFILARKA